MSFDNCTFKKDFYIIEERKAAHKGEVDGERLMVLYIFKEINKRRG